MDHMEFLGDTLEAIAREKAAILRKGVPAVIAEQRPEALGILETCASWVGAPLLLEGRDFSLDGLGRYRGPELALDGLALALHGAHQHHNAAVAVTCARLLEKQGVAVGAEAIRTGLQRTRWPGRLEQVPGHPPLLLDGAHNEDGMAALVAALDAVPYAGRGVHLVFGVVSDKRVDPMLRMLLPRCASATFTPVPTPRSLDPASYLPVARSLCAAVDAAPSPEEALARARLRAGPDAWVLVAGSLYLVGAVKALLEHTPVPR
jgi:dihydrofolate synthase/folylpolyglutamate synthase